MKPPAARLEDAHRAFDLWWLLEGSRILLVADDALMRPPDHVTRLALHAAFLAGVSHALAEASEDLEAAVVEVQRRLRNAAGL